MPDSADDHDDALDRLRAGDVLIAAELGLQAASAALAAGLVVPAP